MPPSISTAFKAFLVGYERAGGTTAKIKHTIENAERLVKSKNKMLEVNGIRIPLADNLMGMIPICYEFCDLILPYLFPYEDGHYLDINKMFIEGPYEIGKVCVDRGDVVFDCGANFGVYSAICAKKGAKVYAFEPSEDVRNNFLSKTAAWNSGIEIVPFGLSDYDGEAFFQYSSDSNTAGQIINSAENENVTDTIKVATIDSFVKKNHIGRVDFIKSDIEGQERNMLRGATKTLREFAPKLSICTYHLPDDPEVIRKIILEANPEYMIDEQYMKLYAYVPR